MRKLFIAIIMAGAIVAPVAAGEPEGPPSCDSSPEVYNECASLIGAPTATPMPSATPAAQPSSGPSSSPSAEFTTATHASIVPMLPDTAMMEGQ